ncbi:MAG: hypothetical protein JSR46_04965, partial [Verrucomicrobia bacterium]|nr:hypothetical protein [Verrucomicrobiota bacterium]
EGVISPIAGSDRGYQDGSRADAQFNYPRAVCMDTKGNLLVTDIGNRRIRKVSPEGTVSTIAGSTSGNRDGIGTEALFHSPSGICIDNKDNMYVSDYWNYNIRKITPGGVVSTVRGSDRDIGWGDIQLKSPSGICLNRYGNLVVADKGNKRIRMIVFPEMTKFVMFCLKHLPTVELPSDVVSYIASLHF